MSGVSVLSSFNLPITIWLGLLAVFLATLISCLILSHYASSLKLIAEPGEHRLHSKPTPMVGGLAVYVGVLVGFFIVDSTFAKLLPALFLLCTIGALDDRYALPSWARFVAQGIASYMMIELTGVKLDTLGYLTPDSEWLLGRWSVPMTIFATIGVINAVNMSDGHDGLAGAIVALTLFALLITGGDAGLAMIGLAALLGFLSLNMRLFRPRARIFMGDAGSTTLGLLLAYLLIKHAQAPNGIWPVTALWLLALPLVDAVAVLIVRPLRGRSPFDADRIHYHHQLVDRGLSVNVAVSIALLIQAGFICLGVWAWQIRIADHLQLMAFLTLFVAYVMSLLWFTRNGKGSMPKNQ